jgi:transketolase
MRTTFIENLVKEAKKDKSIVLLVGDLGFNVVETFQEKFPKRFYNVGVAEQNMMSIAAGLASQGFKVFTYSIANFPTFRCAEQIRNDIDYHNFNVTIVTVGGGYAYGNLGYSHHAVQDYGLMRLFPNFDIIAPADPVEVESALRYILSTNGPKYLRLNKSNDVILHKKKFKISHSKFNYIKKKNNKKLILTTGSTLKNAFNLGRKKKYLDYSIASCLIWSKKNKIKLSNNLKKVSELIVIEDHYQECGFNSFLLEIINELKLKINIKNFSLSSKHQNVSASQEALNKLNKLI